MVFHGICMDLARTKTNLGILDWNVVGASRMAWTLTRMDGTTVGRRTRTAAETAGQFSQKEGQE